jgi:hypothetical protein
MKRCVLGLGVEVYGEVGGRVYADVWLRRGGGDWLLGIGIRTVEDGLCTGRDIGLDVDHGTSAQTEPAAVPEESTDSQCEEDEGADYSAGKGALADPTRL